MKRALILIALVVVLVAQRLDAQSVNLAWDPSPSSEAVGYVIYAGQASGVYSATVDVGSALGGVLNLPSFGTWYIAVTAYDVNHLQGGFSNEVSKALAAPPPPESCAADGTGNGIDEDLDGVIDEGCAIPPPPPPAPKVCVTNGITYSAGTTVTGTFKNGDADTVIAARTAEGWIVLSRSKLRNLTTITFQCRGK